MTVPVFHRLLLVSAALALLAAAALVIVLQREAARRQRERTTAVIEQLCRQTARLAVERLRDHFGAVVFDTLEGIGRPDLSRYNLPRIAEYFDSARTHAYVDRFFLWNERMKPLPREEVLFYRSPEEGAGDVPILGPDGTSRGSLYASPAIGRAVWAEAVRLAALKRAFALVEGRFDDRPYQFVIQYVWAGPERNSFRALVGFTVDLARVRERLFRDMFASGHFAVPDQQRVGVKITVRDPRGEPVFGEVPPPTWPSASESFNLVFYPARALRPWLAGEFPAVPWTLTVSAPAPVVPPQDGGYWLFGTVVFLILTGLVCAVALDRQSRRLSEMQAEFVANVSHQLKTPLALLSAAAETLVRGRVASPEKVREYAGIVRAQAARLSSLVEQAIIFSVVDGDGKGLGSEMVDVSGLVRDVVEQFRSGVPADVRIEFAADAGVPLVKGDAAALEQVVWNLLENAVKYGQEHNSMTISVRASGGEAVMTVQDRGDGIAPEDLPRIFDRFYRGQRHARQRRGFGLGLAYVQKVVTAHGGRISVSSEPGRGSEFRVYLPGEVVSSQ